MTPPPEESTLRETVNKMLDFFTEPGEGEKYLKDLEDDIVQLIHERERLARIDENESIEDILLHEIEKPDHCYNHDKYVSACHGCRTTRYRAKFCQEYLNSLQERLKELNKQAVKAKGVTK